MIWGCTDARNAKLFVWLFHELWVEISVLIGYELIRNSHLWKKLDKGFDYLKSLQTPEWEGLWKTSGIIAYNKDVLMTSTAFLKVPNNVHGNPLVGGVNDW